MASRGRTAENPSILALALARDESFRPEQWNSGRSLRLRDERIELQMCRLRSVHCQFAGDTAVEEGAVMIRSLGVPGCAPHNDEKVPFIHSSRWQNAKICFVIHMSSFLVRKRASRPVNGLQLAT